ncbi:MAG: hypothetical protein OEU36_16165 [Gammaproteobacteria bacterium]|nr:hypothetical protein [Gammaproteobacteria bacterium]
MITLFLGGYVFILVVDPYDSLPLSIPAARVPVDDQQRFFHPALARKPYFDSAIIGTSNIRLLEPRRLNEVLGGSFVNLGLDAASAYEQSRIFGVFARHHANARTVIFGIDFTWCAKQFFVKFIPPRSAGDFPTWMYDEDSYNDVLPYNGRVLRHAWRQFLHLIGVGSYQFGLDGYTVFTNPMDEYDIAKARRNIYKSEQPLEKAPVDPPVVVAPETIAALEFPAIELLSNMLDQLSDETVKVAFFVPYHYYFQPAPGSFEAVKWNECKRRIAETFKAHDNARMLDFMIHSSITTRDENYWDHKHYTVPVASQLVDLIAMGVLTDEENASFRRW